MSKSNDHGCSNRQRLEKEIRVVDAGLDVGETTLLELVRLYCKGFVEPQSEAWMVAFRLAAEIFPPAGSADIAWKTSQMVQAMRCSRRSCFMFNSPTCPGCSKFMTEHERQLMGVLVATRCGRRGEATTHAMLICEGNNTEALMKAAQILSDALGERLQPEFSLKAGFASASAG